MLSFNNPHPYSVLFLVLIVIAKNRQHFRASARSMEIAWGCLGFLVKEEL